MITIIHTHAKHNIRRDQTFGQITIPIDITMGLDLSHLEGMISNDMLRHLNTCYSILPHGTYQMNYHSVHFTKIRGNISIDSLLLPIEIVYAEAGGYRFPIIVRIADKPGVPNYDEYLVFINLVILRYKLFGSSKATSSVFHNIVSLISNIGGDDLSIGQSAALDGCSSPYLTLIPPIEKVSAAIDSFITRPHGLLDNSTSIDRFIQEVYFKEATTETLLQIGGILDGRIPVRVDDNFKPESQTFTHLEYTTSAEINDIEFLNALRGFANFIYDEYTINVYLNSYNFEIEINDIASTSGAFAPVYDFVKIEEHLNLLVHNFITTFNANGGYISRVDSDYFFTSRASNDPFTFGIEGISIEKTIDDELRVILHSKDEVFKFDYDLLFLSILSPEVTMKY